MVSHSRGRVLIIDDDLWVCDGLKDLLVKFMYYVRTASTIEDALIEIVKDRFEAVVLDWILPDGDSREVIEFIHKYSPETTVIVYSAFESSNPECTVALADDFVEKSHRMQNVRFAIERGCQEARRRRRDTSHCVLSSSQQDEWFTDTLIENVCSRVVPQDAPFAVAAETEELAFRISQRIVEKYAQTHTKVYSVDENTSHDQLMIDLFGVADYSKRPFVLNHGYLDSPVPCTLIIRNANRLPKEVQESVAFCIANQEFQRIGSDRILEIDINLVVTMDEGKGDQNKLGDSLLSLFKNNYIIVPGFASLPNSGIPVLNQMINKRFGLDQKHHIGNAAEFLLENYGSHLKWIDTHVVVEECAQHYWHESSRKFEVEDLGLPIIERALTRDFEGATKLSSWDEFIQISQIVYICRVLSETEGNVAEASRLSGLSRTSIYNILNEQSIDRERFRMI